MLRNPLARALPQACIFSRQSITGFPVREDPIRGALLALRTGFCSRLVGGTLHLWMGQGTILVPCWPLVDAEMKIMQYLAVPGHPCVMTPQEILEDDLFYYLVRRPPCWPLGSLWLPVPCVRPPPPVAPIPHRPDYALLPWRGAVPPGKERPRLDPAAH